MRHSKNIGGICDGGHYHFCLECWPRVLTPKREKTIKKKEARERKRENETLPFLLLRYDFFFYSWHRTKHSPNGIEIQRMLLSPSKLSFVSSFRPFQNPKTLKKKRNIICLFFFYFFFQNQIAYDFLCGRTCRGSLIFISFLLFRFTFSLSTAASVAKAGET